MWLALISSCEARDFPIWAVFPNSAQATHNPTVAAAASCNRAELTLISTVTDSQPQGEMRV